METDKAQPVEDKHTDSANDEPPKEQASPEAAPAEAAKEAAPAEAAKHAAPAEAVKEAAPVEGGNLAGAAEASKEGETAAAPAKEAASENQAAAAEASKQGKSAIEAAKEAEPAAEAAKEAEPAAESAKEAEPAAEPAKEAASEKQADAAEASKQGESVTEAAKEAEPAAAVDVVEAAPVTPPEPALVPEADPPIIGTITPAHGPLRGGMRIEISGTRFLDGCKVRIGDAEAETTFESDTLLSATLPARSSFGFADVRVTNPDGKSEVRVHGFSYDIPPLPEFVKPDTLGVRGGLVRVFGEAFAEGAIATINGVLVPVVFKGEDCLEITVPGGVGGPVDITITNPDGQHAELKGKLRLSEGPVIEGVSPNVVLPLGGARITVTGRNFVRGSTVTLFGELAPHVTFESDKKLAFVAPAHEAGQGALRVTNPDGLTTVLESAFEYRAAPAPVVTSLSPDRAWVSGGARLLVSGSDFVEGCTARIDGRDAAVKWKNAGLLEVIVPAGENIGAVDTVVVNPDGQSVTSALFTYERVPAPPKLISVAPNRGPTHGNVTIVLTGDNFDELTVVRIAEVRTTSKVLSKTEMEVLVPARPGEGAVAIELVSGEGVTVRSEDVFYYNDRPPPRITGVAPNQGPMTGNTRVSIEGEGFSQDCFVRIGRERPKSITIKNKELIEIVTPPCKISGFVDIEVGTNQTGSSIAKNMFRFIPLPVPTIDGVSPNRGAVAGGTEISITGKNFHADVIVTIAGKQLKFKLISPDLIETRAPPGTDGQMVDVSVKNPDGKEAVVRRAFAYDARYKQ